MPNDDTAAIDLRDLPTGLAEMIQAFVRGCDAKGKRVAADVPGIIADRFSGCFEANEGSWDPAAAQVLTLARLAGRLAAAYASLDGRLEVQWTHARFGLRDVQAECQTPTRRFGRHCENVDLDLP